MNPMTRSDDLKELCATEPEEQRETVIFPVLLSCRGHGQTVEIIENNAKGLE